MSEQKYITNDGLMWEGILKTGKKITRTNKANF